MIQIIQYENRIKNFFSTDSNIQLTTFSEYQSFDMFDINIIDLNNSCIWKCNSDTITHLNIENDLCTLKNAILTCSSKVVIVLPQNQIFRYKKNYEDGFYKSIELKNITEKVSAMLEKNVIAPFPKINYEKCETTLDGIVYKSDFYFDDVVDNHLTSSNKSNKINTFKNDNIIFTTLNILGYSDELMIKSHLNKFLSLFCNKSEEIEVPKWAEKMNFYDDEKQKNEIEKLNSEIEKLTSKIKERENIIENNKKVKSILYSSGSALSEQINVILKDILSIEDDSFVDVYEEDFRVKLKDVTFIVETKGLTKEVAGKNVSDAYDHLVIYEDKIEEEGLEENTKCLFFVASERYKPIEERKKINKRQETIAKRNNTLIVDTYSFYRMY